MNHSKKKTRKKTHQDVERIESIVVKVVKLIKLFESGSKNNKNALQMKKILDFFYRFQAVCRTMWIVTIDGYYC